VKSVVAIIATVILLVQAGGCANPCQLQADLQHDDPDVRIKAITRAGNTKSTCAVPFLVDRLTDSQKDVRFFAIGALQRITGRTMGWRYYGRPAERARAVQKWRQWLREEYGTASGREQADQTGKSKEDGSI